MKGTQKGSPLVVKMVYKGVGPRGGASPYKTFLVPLRGFSAFLPTTTVKRVKLVVTEVTDGNLAITCYFLSRVAVRKLFV